MRRKHRKTLDAIFAIPVPANIAWSDIIGLFRALGAELREGRGSRVRVSLNEVDAVFHRPHPQRETDKGAVVSVRRFLQEAGISPPEHTNACGHG
jgi:HicA toxin of bacterial toxin-antitoxin,